MPKIMRINRLKEYHGVMKFDVETERGRREFETRYKEDIRRLTGGRVVIKDADGNRYEIEDYRKLDEQMQKFNAETEALRQKIYAKDLALRSELAKEKPNTQKASEMQKELSQLESEFDQKGIDHLITLRKNFPDFNKGFTGRGGRGGYGPGYCWR